MAPNTFLLMIPAALVALNAATFVLFGLDKMRAEAGQRRFREADLLMLALLGGSLGAYAGRAAFRHKTRKQSFSGRLHAVAVLQLMCAIAALEWWLGD